MLADTIRKLWCRQMTERADSQRTCQWLHMKLLFRMSLHKTFQVIFIRRCLVDQNTIRHGDTRFDQLGLGGLFIIAQSADLFSGQVTQSSNKKMRSLTITDTKKRALC